ncbi:MAG: DUF2863 family protein [Pseudomonadota bacterium]
MAKNKKPAPRKSGPSAEDIADTLTQTLCDLAMDLVEQEDIETMTEALKQKEIDFRKLVRKCLNQKKDDILYSALERAKHADIGAYQFLKEHLEQASQTLVMRREEGGVVEVDAFVIPLFVHTSGGLVSGECFQDQDAYDQLTASFKKAHLESHDARVVLVSHAYHPDEIDSITFSNLTDMIRDVYSSMSGKKAVAAPAIERSFSGWPASHFEPGDQAVELRFLLGFSLKASEDPFYQVPDEETAADAYFDQRAERFQRWTEQVAPLVKSCLVAPGREAEVNFLYQDLFHGGKERGIAELFMLQMMSELDQGLQAHGAAPENVSAVIGPADVMGDIILRVNLHAGADGALLVSAEKPLGPEADLQVDVDDIVDALQTIGIQSVALAKKFDAAGEPVDVRPIE